MPHRRRRFPFDDEERLKWLDPDEVLDAVALGPGMVFIDVGCGEGYFAVPAARRVGKSGRVYALDLDPASIARLEETARRERIDNIVAVAGEGEATMMCDGCGDIVFFGTVLHDFSDAGRVLANARSMVSEGGKLVNLDWKKEDTPVGPPLSIRFDQATATRLITDAGFVVESVEDAGQYFYLVTALPGRPGPGPRPTVGF